MNIEDLPKLLSKLEDRAAEQEAMKSAMLEISTTLADLLALLEKQGPETARAIADSLKSLTINQAAPTITIPPSPAPVVTVMEKEDKPRAGWDVEFKFDRMGDVTGMKLKPL